jgi:AraC-like DNA-binding protein
MRITFLVVFGSAVAACTVLNKVFISSGNSALIQEWIVTLSAVSIMITTQGIIFYQHATKLNQTVTRAEGGNTTFSVPVGNSDPVDEELANSISLVLIDKKGFLQTNLKVADIARELKVPEYKVSHIIRHHFGAGNFNQYINQLRIKHAKTLLQDQSIKHWPVLVIAMESGFASVGPFNRAFKEICGSTPNQYRQTRLTMKQDDKDYQSSHVYM